MTSQEVLKVNKHADKNLAAIQAAAKKGDFCGTYLKVKPLIESLLAIVQKWPINVVFGQKALQAISVFFGLLDMQCPAPQPKPKKK